MTIKNIFYKIKQHRVVTNLIVNLYGAINHFFFLVRVKKVRVFRTFDEIGSESYWRSSAYEGTFMPTICFSVGHI